MTVDAQAPFIASLELEVVRARDVEVDLGAYLAQVRGQRIFMPARELQILFLLVANAGRIVPREDFIARLWGASGDSNKSLNVHIRRLRGRIEFDPHHPGYIRTVRGIGYIFDS